MVTQGTGFLLHGVVPTSCGRSAAKPDLDLGSGVKDAFQDLGLSCQLSQAPVNPRTLGHQSTF